MLSVAYASGASPVGGQCSPIFVFAPPDFFLAPPRYFFKLMCLGGKNDEICDFGQKKPSDFGEDLFFEITYFLAEKSRFRPEKAFGFRRKPLPP